MSLGSTIINVLFWTFQWLYHKILDFVHSSAQQGIPTTRNYILMESATSLASKIRNKKITSTEIIECFIERIREVNDGLNCVIHARFEDALKEAKKADDLIKSDTKTVEELERDMPLLGVPFTVSGSISVKGLLHTQGLLNSKETIEVDDAEVVAEVRKAGGIPIACTNVSEGCYTIETNNPIYGRTQNPYNPNRTVGGSSGGEACLISSSASCLGISCDFKTSLRLSGSFAGVFTHTPSANSISLIGLRPEPPTLGPISKSSEDLLTMLKILAKSHSTILKLNEAVDTKNIKYYFMDCDGIDEEIKEKLEQAVSHFKNTLKANVEKVDIKHMKNAFNIWMAKRGKDSRKRFIKISEEKKTNTLVEMVKGFCGRSRHSLSFVMTLLMEERLKGSINSNINQLMDEYDELSKELQTLLGTDGVLIYPTQPSGAFLHNETLTKIFDIGYTGIFSILGLPVTHCPVGLNSQDLPVGLQIVGGMNQDRLTLAVAKELEKILGGWKPPPTRGTYTLKKAALETPTKNNQFERKKVIDKW